MAEGGTATESCSLVETSLKVGKYPPSLESTVGGDSKQEGDFSTQEEVDQTDVPICGICFEDRPILSHVIEECGHLFCEHCLMRHCHYAIEQGTWIIKCAGSGCDVTIPSDLLWNVLDEKTLIRQQEKAKEQETERRVLEEEREVDWCPHCRGISRVNSEVYSGGRRRADCEKCAHAFCTRCRDWWHGRLGECSHRVWKNKRTSSRITISGEPGSDGMEGWEERVKGRKKYDALSNKLIMDTTTPCPKCHVPIYRTAGCNSMLCGRCKHSFCYGCGSAFPGCRCRMTNLEPAIVSAIRGILSIDPFAFDRTECAACPACHRMNRKRNTNNHIRCVVCKISYCFTCKKSLTGNVGGHYKKGMPCVQHTPAKTTITSADVVYWCQDMYGKCAEGLIYLIKPRRRILERGMSEGWKMQKQIYDAVKAIELELEEKAVKERMENVIPGDVVRKIDVILDSGSRSVELYSN